MPSNRSKLPLDEQSFQALLAAAYTIQEHAGLLKPVTSTSRKTVPEAQSKAARLCRHCGAAIKENELRCAGCGREDSSLEEHRQNIFLSLDGVPPEGKAGSVDALVPSESALMREANPFAEIRESEQDALQLKDESMTDPLVEGDHPLRLAALDSLMESVNLSDGPQGALAEFRQRLDRHRADLYLGLSVLVALLALLWPSAAPPQKPRLDTWQRVLVTLGIAEAPPPQIHYQGDPNIQVWVDPHTALYYCAGDELYGKAAGGRLTSQRDAQADQFEPASRAACN
jgi:hypothetical protein